MTDDPKPPPPDAGGLQFDRAETSHPAGPACAICKSPLTAEYYLTGAAKVCGDCRGGYQQAMGSGSKGGRLLKAGLLGLLAALVGGGLWAVVTYATGWMIGLIAVAMGYLVGIAVRRGSEGRGGRGYQVMALILAYFGVATGYMGLVVAEMSKGKSTPGVEKTVEKPGDPRPEKPAKSGTEVPRPDTAGCVGAFGMLALVYAGMPFLVGKEDPFTFLFLGIALWEAWKLNAGVVVKMTGPFRLGDSRAPEKPPNG